MKKTQLIALSIFFTFLFILILIYISLTTSANLQFVYYLFILIFSLLYTKKQNSLATRQYILLLTFFLLITLSLIQQIFSFWRDLTIHILFTSLVLLILLRFQTPLLSHPPEKITEEKTRGVIPRFSAFHNIQKLIHEEGSFYIYSLLFVLALGLSLRIWNSAIVGPAGDEFRHLIAAKRFFVEGFFQYSRSETVSFILIIIQKILNTNNILLLRIPFVLLGGVSTLLFYITGRIINKKTGLIAAYLFAVCPLAIGLASYIREYEIALFFIILTIYLVARFGTFNKKHIILLLIYFIALGTYYYFDSFLGLKVAIFSGTLLLVVQLFLLKLYSLQYLTRSSCALIQLVLSIIGGYFAFLLLPLLTSFSVSSKPHLEYLFFFNFPSLPSLWFFWFIPPAIIIILYTLPLFTEFYNPHTYSWTMGATFLILIYTYFTFLDNIRPFQDRYAYYVIPLFILIISRGIDTAYSSLRQNHPYFRTTILFSCLMLIIFSPINAIYNNAVLADGYTSRNSGLAYLNSQAVISFIKENNIPPSRIITTYPWIIDYYLDEPFLREEEKPQYIYFQSDQLFFERFDRTKTFSIGSWWDAQDQATLRQLIQENRFDYFIAHVPLVSENPRFNLALLLSNIPQLELIKTIDSEKTFGFYIFRVRHERN